MSKVAFCELSKYVCMHDTVAVFQARRQHGDSGKEGRGGVAVASCAAYRGVRVFRYSYDQHVRSIGKTNQLFVWKLHSFCCVDGGCSLFFGFRARDSFPDGHFATTRPLPPSSTSWCSIYDRKTDGRFMISATTTNLLGKTTWSVPGSELCLRPPRSLHVPVWQSNRA